MGWRGTGNRFAEDGFKKFQRIQLEDASAEPENRGRRIHSNRCEYHQV